MDEELMLKIKKILETLPDEGPLLDYKVKPYCTDEELVEMTKDVCAFLNSTESYGKDRFIIFGVVDKTKHLEDIGDSMPDDNKYQNALNEISPRPHVETGTIIYNGLKFGYIYIASDNQDRVYSVKKIYVSPSKKLSGDNNSNDKVKIDIFQAYIRRGSGNCLLDEYTRRKIYDFDRDRLKTDKLVYPFKEQPLIVDNNYENILRTCALFGTGNETNEYEKNIISQVIGVEYSEGIEVLKELLRKKSEYVSYKNHIGNIKNKNQLIEQFADEYFESDINCFIDATIDVIKEIDPRLNIEPENRIISSLMGKKSNYSKAIKKSCLETILFMKMSSKLFVNCNMAIKRKTTAFIRSLFANVDWKIYASLDELLPTVAEIDEDEYIKQVKQLLNDENTIQTLIAEKDGDIFEHRYVMGLMSSLQLLAGNKKNIMEVFEIYSKLYEYDKNVIDDMTRILLPWYPQTTASIEARHNIVEFLLKEHPELGGQLLMKLMPNETRDSFSNCKPKGLGIEENEVSKSDVYDEYCEYANLAIHNCKNNVNRIIDMENKIANLADEQFELLCNHISSNKILELNDEEKYLIGDNLGNIIAKHNMYQEAEGSMDAEQIKKLKELFELIKPKSKMVYMKRIFNINFMDARTSKDETFEETKDRILKEQIDSVESLVRENFNDVFQFSKTVVNPFEVGYALAFVELTDEQENKVILELNDKNVRFAQGYIDGNIYNKEYNWLEKVNVDSLTLTGKINLLLILPNKIETGELVSKLLDKNESMYGEKNDIRIIDEQADGNYAFEKLLTVNRPGKIIELIDLAIHRKINFLREYSVKALKLLLNNQDKMENANSYDIEEIFSDLQISNYNEDELFSLEGSYLPIFDHLDNYRPITIEKRISKDPNIFNEILSFAYKSKDDKKNKVLNNKNISINAYRILNMGSYIPGYDEERNIIDATALKEWVNKCLEISTANGRGDIANEIIGQVLYNSPHDEDGFGINKNIAEILNEPENENMRRGYITKAFNSVGAVFIDREGSAGLKEKEKGDERAELSYASYPRFSKALGTLASDFEEMAENEKRNY